MSKIAYIPEKEKKSLYKKVRSDLEKLEEKHGSDVFIWGANKYIITKRERAKIAKKLHQLEQELAKLGDN